MTDFERKQNTITLESSLQGFFFDELNNVNRKSSNPLPQETIYYSSNVMDKFGSTENFFEFDEGKVREKILGLKLLESSQLSTAQQKAALLDVGDTALIVCGFFSDSLNKKLVDARYYRDLGITAYNRLNSYVPEIMEVQDFYQDLGRRFDALTTLMTVISKKLHLEPKVSEEFILFFADQKTIKAC